MHGFLRVIVLSPFFQSRGDSRSPIELLQSILRCSSIALRLIFELTNPSSPPRVLCTLL